ncbi:MAG: hypothetical protein V2A54_10040 [Bacteroidota bacterium]
MASAITYESITVADTAVGFDSDKITSYTTAFCTATADVNFRFDAAPTALNGGGHRAIAGSLIRFTSKELGVKFIRINAVTTLVNCSYE